MRVGTRDSVEYALLAIGIILSGYLLYHHYEIRLDPSKKSFCTVSEDINCDVVALHSSSEVLGIPLAVYGLGYYFLLACLLGWARRLQEQILSCYASVFKGLGFLISIYLFVISKWLIGSLCLICCGTYLINFCLLLQVLFKSDFSWKGALIQVYRDVQVKT